MYLKSLRIKGFKSFAKPVEIDLTRDISAIVGPNGSGKSNIIDAIRWVLGEQRSRALRGKNMEDVIFSGTDTVPAQNVAEVCLTFDNRDAFLDNYPDEVAITRRLYRSGESAYQINHRNVRLKDIQALFADTGLGRNGYSIVSQGSIENIVNASPMALREIVEEAVGIVGYKIRKQEAERKLAATQDNMDRVSDILEELTRQHGPLKRQAEKAKKYLDLYEKLRAVDYKLFEERSEELAQKLDKTQTALSQSDAARHDIQVAIHDADAAYQKMRNENAHASDKRDVLTRQTNTLRKNHADAQSQKMVLAEKKRHLLEEKARLEQTKAADQAKYDALAAQQQDDDKHHAELEQTARDVAAALSQAEEKQKGITIQVASADKQLTEKNDALRRAYIDKRLAAEQAEDKLRQIHREYDEAKNTLHLNQSKRDYLKEMQEQYRDYFPGIRLIMSGSGLKREVQDAVYGPVASLIRFPENLTRAIDTALGGRSQNVVVKNIAAANACITLLKKRHAGRETFLPIDNLNYRMMPERDRAAVLNFAGVVGIASELVECADDVRPAIDSLLGRTIITVDFDAARTVRSRFKGYTLVTLSGEVFYPGGAIVGGETKNKKRSPLVKNAEIVHFDRDIEKLTKKLKQIKQTYAAEKQQVITLKTAMQDAKQALDDSEQALWKDRDAQRAAAAEKRQAANDAIAQIKVRAAKVEAAIAAHDKQQADLKKRMAAAQAVIDADTQLCRKNAAAIKALADEALTNEQAIAQTEQALSDFKKRYADFEAENKRRSGAIAEIERRIQNLNHDLIVENDHHNQLDMTKTRIQAVRDNLEERMGNRYGVTALMISDWLKAHDLSGVDVSKTAQQRLSDEIASLGHVNVEAITSFDELDERYRFVKKQYDDLVAGKKAVEDVIAALYSSMEKQFAEGFAELQTAFSDIFEILFEGGRAELSYEDPEHILESGIILAAQPPGKHLKQMSLLSGGEKSMTAIALLFAFLKRNPSPFCVIDEVDAALDDHNIDRFTRYLKTISDKTQFILITHRKNTLAVCDTIYGISMAKSGVSKLVSMHVSDYTA